MKVFYQTVPEFGFCYALRTPHHMERHLPVIFQLHGAGERGDQHQLPKVEASGFAHYFSAEREIPCILVEPQCPEGTFWVAMIPQIVTFIREMVKKLDCDRSRVYLTGMSMGGYGTWYTAMACPELFAAIAPCCGGGMPWNAAVLKMPIWAFHGALDEAVNVNESIAMVKAVQAAGGTAQLTIHGDCGHDVWNRTYEAELYQWLLSKRREDVNEGLPFSK